MLSIQLSRNYIRKKPLKTINPNYLLYCHCFTDWKYEMQAWFDFKNANCSPRFLWTIVILNLFHCQTRLSSSSIGRWRPGMKVNSFFWILPFLLFRGRVPKIFEKLSPFFEGDLQTLLVTLILRCLLSDVFFTSLLPVGRKQSSSVLDCRLKTSLAGSSKTLDW